MKKRMVSLFLAAVMCATLLRTAAFATGQVQDKPQADGDKCICETLCTTDAINTDCPVCGADGADLTACKGGKAATPSDALKLTAEQVQELIDALPSLEGLKAMTAEQQQAACMEIQNAYDAYKALTEEEQAQITGAEIFESLLEFFNSMAAPLQEGGDLGGSLSWDLENGTLTISGNGAMPNFSNDYSPPWLSLGDSITSVTIGEGVTTVGDHAFDNDAGDYGNLSNVTFSNSVETIGEQAFENCGLTALTIPGSVRTIKKEAFAYCKLQAVNILNGVTTIEDWAFVNNLALTTVTVPESVTEIGFQAFYDTPWLTDMANTNNGFAVVNGILLLYNGNETEVIIPDNVTSIVGAFFAKNNITGVTVPDSVVTIGKYAFSDCYGLTSITIPESVEKIGIGAFDSCQKLSAIISKGQAAPEWVDGTPFDSCPVSSLVIPEGATGYEGWPGYQNHKTGYSVTVLNGVGGEASASPDFAAQDTTIALKASPASGYHFKEWKIQPGNVTITDNQFTMPGSDVTVTAAFEAHDYNYASNGDGTHQVTCSRSGCTAANEAKQDCSLNDDGDCTTAVICSYCRYEQTPAQASHSYGDWTSNNNGTHTKRCGNSNCEAMETENCTRSGNDCTKADKCRFCGWDIPKRASHDFGNNNVCSVCGYIKQDTNSDGDSGGGTILPTYSTLTFETNGGSQVGSLTKPYGEKVGLTGYVPAREGYVFDGWFADKALTKRITEITLDGNKTVYAGWTAAAPAEQPAQTGPDAVKIPQTGDGFDPAWVIGLMLLSAAAMAAAGAKRARKRDDDALFMG